MKALIIAEARRALLLRSPLAAAGTSSVILGSWEEARYALEPGYDFDLVVVDLDTLHGQGLQWLLLARTDLASVKTPTLLAFDSTPIKDVRKFKFYTQATKAVAVGAEAPDLSSDYNALVPGVARNSGPPVTGVVELKLDTIADAYCGWFESVPAAGFIHTPRVHVTMPSLSRGKLERTPMPRLLYLLAVQRRTGLLTVANGKLTAKIGLQEGTICDLGDPRNMGRTHSAFGWRTGSYQFEDTDNSQEPHADGDCVVAADFILDGIVECVPFNELAQRLAPHAQHNPAATTLLRLRGDGNSAVALARTLLKGCDGTQTFSEFVAGRDRPIDDMMIAFVFGLCCDEVVFFTEAVDSPVGVSYRLRDGEVVDELTPEHLPPTTMQRLARLDPKQKEIVTRLKELRDTLGATNPYVALGLQPGCGKNAVQEAFFRLMADHQLETFTSTDEPLVKMSANLAAGAMLEAYQLVLAKERRNDSSGFGRKRHRTEPNTESLEALLDDMD